MIVVEANFHFDGLRRFKKKGVQVAPVTWLCVCVCLKMLFIYIPCLQNKKKKQHRSFKMRCAWIKFQFRTFKGSVYVYRTDLLT